MVEKRGYFVRDEDGNTHGLIGSIGDELAARGVIFKDFHGRWCIKNKDVDYVDRHMELAVCDFCSERPVTFDIDCESFAIDDELGSHTSVGGWAACETCGRLVQAGEKEELLARCFAFHFKAKLVPIEWAREHLREFHEAFWHNYKGIRPIPARPFGH